MYVYIIYILYIYIYIYIYTYIYRQSASNTCHKATRRCLFRHMTESFPRTGDVSTSAQTSNAPSCPANLSPSLESSAHLRVMHNGMKEQFAGGLAAFCIRPTLPERRHVYMWTICAYLPGGDLQYEYYTCYNCIHTLQPLQFTSVYIYMNIYIYIYIYTYIHICIMYMYTNTQPHLSTDDSTSN